MGWQPESKAKTAGFTLVELMVTLAVMAVLVTLAAPSYNSFIRNQRVKTAAFDLMSSINFARSEAIKRNGDVGINATGDWTSGWKVKFDSDDDGDIDDDDDTLREQAAHSDIDITASPNVSTITYQRTGRISGTAGLSLTICDADSSAFIAKRVVSIDLSGRPNLTQNGMCDE